MLNRDIEFMDGIDESQLLRVRLMILRAYASRPSVSLCGERLLLPEFDDVTVESIGE